MTAVTIHMDKGMQFLVNKWRRLDRMSNRANARWMQRVHDDIGSESAERALHLYRKLDRRRDDVAQVLARHISSMLADSADAAGGEEK